MTCYETAKAEVRAEYDDQIKKNGRITNMKRTLLHSVPAFKAYMEWYTLRDLIIPFLGERTISIFAYAISTGNECLICSTFFRKILIDAGDDPDNITLSDLEKLFFDFGLAIARNPGNVPNEIYSRLRELFADEQLVLIIGFAGIMTATNVFNTIAKVPLDEVLYDYTKKE
jgi:alkylhydroperoxidase family enzyme